jgi:tRNA_anti-like
MPTINNDKSLMKWLPAFFAVILLVSFFLPWVAWKDATLSGNAMPSGAFFYAAREKFGVDNPFPQFSFAFKIFWVIPVAALAVIVFLLLKKTSIWPAIVAGLLSLSLVLVYFLFSKSMVDQLGVSRSVWAMTKPWLFIHMLAAVAIVLSTGQGKWWLKSGLILATALLSIVGFTIISKQVEKKILKETFETTDNIKADYILSSEELIKEFMVNDTAANKKYLDKVLAISGPVASIDIATDSSSTIKFADSTGSYAIFSLEKTQLNKVKMIKAGDTVSVKGVCSGRMFSEILGTTTISFKRSILNKQ